VRYALRFLSYLQRSVTTRRNFVLVSHADCVGAVLSIMPSMMDKVVTGVEYGALFLARRKLMVDTPKTEGNGHFMTVLPTASESGQSANPNLDDLEVCEADLRSLLAPKYQGNLMQGEISEVPASHSLKQSKACEGWQVDLQSIIMRKREGAGKFKKRVKALAKKSDFTLGRIAQLLGDMGDKSLAADSSGGDNERELNSAQVSRRCSLNSRSSNMANTCCSLSTYLFGASEGDLDGMSQEDQAGSVEEAAIAARRSMLRRPSERRLSDNPSECSRENLGGSNAEHVRRRRRSTTDCVLDGVNGEHVQSTTHSGSNCASDRLATSSSSLRPRLSSLRSLRHRSSCSASQSGQPLSPRTPLLEKVCEKVPERTNEEEPGPEKGLTIIAREVGTHLKPPTRLQVPQSCTQGDRQFHSDEHVAGIAGVKNLGKGLQQPPSQSVRKKDQSDLLIRRRIKAPSSLHIDRSGDDGTTVPKHKPACEAKPLSRGSTPPPAEEPGMPGISVLPPDEGRVPNTPTALASQPLILPTIVATGMGSSVPSAGGIQMPALRDLRSSSLMHRRSSSSSAAATKQGKAASKQAQSDAVPEQQQQPPSHMKTATPATGSVESANAAAALVKTSLGHRLQPRPPLEDARRLVKERPRPRWRGWTALA